MPQVIGPGNASSEIQQLRLSEPRSNGSLL
jgi:hypothetical protein